MKLAFVRFPIETSHMVRSGVFGPMAVQLVEKVALEQAACVAQPGASAMCGVMANFGTLLLTVNIFFRPCPICQFIV
jgi:hypothetical protein